MIPGVAFGFGSQVLLKELWFLRCPILKGGIFTGPKHSKELYFLGILTFISKAEQRNLMSVGKSLLFEIVTV